MAEIKRGQSIVGSYSFNVQVVDDAVWISFVPPHDSYGSLTIRLAIADAGLLMQRMEAEIEEYNAAFNKARKGGSGGKVL